MELKGKIYKILERQTGTGKKGDWKKQTIVIEADNGKYPKKVAVTFWNDILDNNNFSEGAELEVKFSVESREYNGKWYTDVTGFSIDKNTSSPMSINRDASKPEDKPTPPPSFTEPDMDDDLPF